MPSNVGRSCSIRSSNANLTLKSATQNVPAGAMAEQLTSVAANSTGRMVVGALLVLAYCLTSCFGVPQLPAPFPRTLDSDGRLERIAHASNNADSYDRFALSRILHLGEDTKADAGLDNKSNKPSRRERNKKQSLKKLLENLTKLHHRYAEESSEPHTVRHGEGHSTSTETAGRLGVNTIEQQNYYHLQPGFPFNQKQNREQLFLSPIQIVAQLDMVLSHQDDNIKTTSVNKEPQKHKQFNTNHFPSVHDEPATNVRSAFNDKVYEYMYERDDVNDKEIADNAFEMRRSGLDRAAIDPDEDNYLVSRITAPANFDPSDFNTDIISRNDFQSGDIQDESENNNSNVKSNFLDIPRESVAKATGIDSLARDIHDSDPTSEGSDQLGNALSVNSLIHKTVKKMEGIMQKRVAHYNGIYDAESTSNSHAGISKTNTQKGRNAVFTNSDSYIATPMGQSGAVNSDLTENDDKTDSDILLSQSYHNHVNDVISAVSNAVASRTLPRDAQFWRDVSSYLDSSDYLSRTRRSPDRSRKRAQYVHLSITYGHVMPCEYKDRFYCMNGGTCVFVGALDIKTCRCPIGYTGVRCEMIDQEYILSLLTNTLIFS